MLRLFCTCIMRRNSIEIIEIIGWPLFHHAQIYRILGVIEGHLSSLSFSRWIADLVMCRHVERWAIFLFSTSLLQVLILPVICPIHLPFCWQVPQFQFIRNTPTTGCAIYDDFYLVLCIWISSVQQLLILAEKLIWLQQHLYHSQYVFHRGQQTLVSRPLLARKHSFNMTTHKLRQRENIILAEKKRYKPVTEAGTSLYVIYP